MRKTRFLLHGIIFGALLMAVVFLLVSPKDFAHTDIERTSVAASAAVGDSKTERAEVPCLTGTSTPYVFDGEATTGFSSSEMRLLSSQETVTTTEVENEDATAPREGTDSANAVWITVSILFIILFIVAVGGMVYFMLLHRKTLKEMQVAEAEHQRRLQEMQDALGRVKDELRQELYKTNTAIENLANQASRSDRQLIEYFKKEIDWLGERIEKRISVPGQDESPMPQGEDKLVALEGQVKELSETNAQLEGQVKELSETNAQLKGQVEELSEENEELKKPRFVGRPIEDYLPAIDKTLDDATSFKYDENNPKLSFETQREQLRIIEKLIDRYRSQR